MPSTPILAGLVVVIFLAAYFAYAFLSQGSGESGRSYCLLHAGYSCAAFQFDSAGGVLLDLSQSTGSAVTLTGIGCTEYPLPSFIDRLLGTKQGIPEVSVTPLSNPIRIEDRAHAVITGGASGNAPPVCCASASSGAECKARVAFRVSLENASVSQIIVGDVTGRLR